MQGGHMSQQWLARQALMAVTDPLNILDRNYRIIWANKARAELHQRSVEEMMGKYCYDMFQGRNEPCEGCPVSETFGTSKPCLRERSSLRSDGNRVWTETYAWPVFEDGGTVSYVVEYARNITERKHVEEELAEYHKHLEDLVRVRTAELSAANEELKNEIAERKHVEEALRESEARYRELFETSLDGIAVTDLQGKYLDCNCAYLKLLGYDSVDELRLKFYEEITPPEYYELEKRIIKEQTMVKGYCDEYEKEYIRKTGERISVSLRAWLRCDLHNTPIGMWAIVRDITERKQAENTIRKAHDGLEMRVQERTAELKRVNKELEAEIDMRKHIEQALRESEEKYRTVADFTYDWETWIGPDGKYLYISPACERITGYPIEEFFSNPDMLFQIIHPDDTDKIRKRFVKDKIEDKIDSCSIDFRIITKNGEERWISHCCQPVYDKNGRYLGRRAGNRDITDRRRAEESLRVLSKQLRSLSVHLQSAREEERTNIAREIHDELGQMLTVLKMEFRLLIDELSTDQERAVESIKTINRIMDKAIDTAQRVCMELRPAIVDELGLPAAIEWQIKEIEKKSDIRCKTIFKPQVIAIDKHYSIGLFRIFQEVMNNVVRHARATKVNIRLEKKRHRITFSVKDNGTGITDEQIRDFKSLGLIGIRERVQFLGGSFEIKGVKNKGTTVVITVPLNAEKNKSRHVKKNKKEVAN
jgi:PAS domain S-box-containing protein